MLQLCYPVNSFSYWAIAIHGRSNSGDFQFIIELYVIFLCLLSLNQNVSFVIIVQSFFKSKSNWPICSKAWFSICRAQPKTALLSIGPDSSKQSLYRPIYRSLAATKPPANLWGRTYPSLWLGWLKSELLLSHLHSLHSSQTLHLLNAVAQL